MDSGGQIKVEDECKAIEEEGLSGWEPFNLIGNLEEEVEYAFYQTHLEESTYSDDNEATCQYP